MNRKERSMGTENLPSLISFFAVLFNIYRPRNLLSYSSVKGIQTLLHPFTTVFSVFKLCSHLSYLIYIQVLQPLLLLDIFKFYNHISYLIYSSSATSSPAWYIQACNDQSYLIYSSSAMFSPTCYIQAMQSPFSVSNVQAQQFPVLLLFCFVASGYQRIC